MGLFDKPKPSGKGEEDAREGKKDDIAYNLDKEYRRAYDRTQDALKGEKNIIAYIYDKEYRKTYDSIQDARTDSRDPIAYARDKEYREGYDRERGRMAGEEARKLIGGNIAGDIERGLGSKAFKEGYDVGRSYSPRRTRRAQERKKEPRAAARVRRIEERSRRSYAGGGSGGSSGGKGGCRGCLIVLLTIIVFSFAIVGLSNQISDIALVSYVRGAYTEIESLLPTIDLFPISSDEESIYIVDIRNGNERELALGSSPLWSPDGTKIAFEQESILGNRTVLMSVDGDGLKKTFLHFTGPVSWSPDGSRFVVGKGVDNLVIVSAKGEILQEIRPPGVEGSTNPAYVQWSPSGGKIAFAVGGGRTPWYVYIMNDDGTNIGRLAAGQWFSWAPNGYYLAIYNGESRSLILTTCNGRDKFEVTAPGMGGWDFGWLPEGRSLIFSSNGNLQVYQPLQSGMGTKNKIGQGECPRYSPYGLWFAYKRDGFLYVRNIWTQEDTKIPYSGGCQSFVWSPDGYKLAFSAGGWIHVVQPDGSEHTKLVKGASPVWSPDGTKIAYVR